MLLLDSVGAGVKKAPLWLQGDFSLSMLVFWGMKELQGLATSQLSFPAVVVKCLLAFLPWPKSHCTGVSGAKLFPDGLT